MQNNWLKTNIQIEVMVPEQKDPVNYGFSNLVETVTDEQILSFSQTVSSLTVGELARTLVTEKHIVEA